LGGQHTFDVVHQVRQGRVRSFIDFGRPCWLILERSVIDNVALWTGP
jgi:hypothetical protein